MKLKFVDKEKKGFARYCPTFARGYEVMRAGILTIKAKQLVKKLNHDDMDVRKKVMIGLYNAAVYGGDISTAVPALVRALGDENRDISYYAAQNLGLAASNEVKIAIAIPALTKAIEDDKHHIRNSVAFALSRASYNYEDITAAIPALIKTLGNEKRHSQDHDAAVGNSIPIHIDRCLRNVLTNEKSKDMVLELLIKSLEDKDDHTRSEVARVFADAAKEGLDVSSALPALMKVLRDREVGVREGASNTLGWAAIQGAKIDMAIPALGKLLGDKFMDIRYNAAWALAAASMDEKTREVVLCEISKALGIKRDDFREFLYALGKVQGTTEKEKIKEVFFDTLMNALRNSAKEVLSSAWALGNALMYGMAVPPLVEALGNNYNNEGIDAYKKLSKAAGESSEIRAIILSAVMELTNSHEFIVEAEKNSDYFVNAVKNTHALLRKIDKLEKQAA